MTGMMDTGTDETRMAYEELIKKALLFLNDQLISDLSEMCRQAIEIDKERCEAYFLLSVGAYLLDDLGRAAELAMRGHEMSPDCKEGNDILAHLQAHVGKLDDSIYFAKLNAVSESNPLLAGLQVSGLDDLAKALHETREMSYRYDAMRAYNEERYGDAVMIFEKELRLRNGDSELFRKFGLSLCKYGEVRRGIAAFHGAIHMEPDNAEGYLYLGDAYLKAGDRDLARACYRRALQLADDDTSIVSGISFYRASIADNWPEFDTAVDKWHDDHRPENEAKDKKKTKAKVKTKKKSAGEMIRIGYLLDRAAQCDEMRIIEPVLWHYDRNDTQIFVYSSDVPDDPSAESLKGLVAFWMDIRDASDDMVSNTIRSHDLDILIDMTLTAKGQRPGVIAMRPCAQIYRWFGPMDGVFAHLYDGVVPVGRTPFRSFATEPVTLDGKCMPTVDGNSPCHVRKYITFGTTADVSRVTPDVAMAWAEILRRVPDSRLLLGNVYNIPTGIESRFMEIFATAGVVDRIQFEELERNDVDGLIVTRLKFMVQIDVYLDTFPVPSFIELADALWTGVPPISLMGTENGHLGPSVILGAAGFPDLIAKDLPSYIDLAVATASSVHEDADWRMTMHKKVKGSILFQPETWKEAHCKLLNTLAGRSG